MHSFKTNTANFHFNQEMHGDIIIEDDNGGEVRIDFKDLAFFFTNKYPLFHFNTDVSSMINQLTEENKIAIHRLYEGLSGLKVCEIRVNEAENHEEPRWQCYKFTGETYEQVLRASKLYAESQRII